MVGILDANVAGRGIRYANIGSVFIARDAVAANELAMLAEDLTDDAAVLTENSGANDGTLANTVDIDANAADGTEMATIVLATEVAAVGGVYRAWVEAYYVDGTLNAAGAPRGQLSILIGTTGQFDTTPAAGQYVHGRALQTTGGSGLCKIHFCGTPGGFGQA